MTDTCKNDVSNFVWKPLNNLYHYANENVSVKPLPYVCITSILTTVYSLKNLSVYEDLVVNTALNHSGSF